MSTKQFQITKTVTVTTRDVNMRLDLSEADAHAPVPGGLYGSLVLTDERGDVLGRRTITPADLEPVAAHLAALKQSAMDELGIEEVPSV